MRGRLGCGLLTGAAVGSGGQAGVVQHMLAVPACTAFPAAPLISVAVLSARAHPPRPALCVLQAALADTAS